MKNNEITIGLFGGNGFLAKYAIEKLCKQGYRIKVGTRKPWLSNHLRVMGTLGQLEVMTANPFSPKDVKKVLKNCDYCINFCGQLFEKKTSFQQLHSQWPEMLSQMSNELGIKKLIHISALNLRENHPSKYMQSKMLGEKKIQENFENYFILRPSLIIGNGDDKFFSTFGTMAQFSPIIPLPGGGRTMFSPVLATDCAKAIVKLLEIENPKNRIFEATGPSNYSLRNLIEIFLKEIKKRRLLVSVPWGIMKLQSYFLQYLPKPPFTPDQILLLQHNSVASGKYPLLTTLGITPQDIQSVFSFWKRFRVGGQFG